MNARRLPEQGLWDRCRKHLGPHMFIERLENLLDAGWPDVVTMCDGNVTWIETKKAEWGKRATTRIQLSNPLTSEQRNWHLNCAKQGCRSIILIEIERQIFAVGGKYADEVNGMKRERLMQFEEIWPRLLRGLEDIRMHRRLGEPR